jgi:hypothetical protein
MTGDGDLVACYTATDRLTGRVSLVLSSSFDGGISWDQEPREIPSSSGNGAMSGDVVATKSGIGLVYSDGRSIKWLEYSYRDGLKPAFDSEVLIERGSEQGDPNGTHFSLVTDPKGNIHLATNNGEGRVVYLRYDEKSDVWSKPEVIANYQSGDYMQISLAGDGRLYLAYNARVGLETIAEVSSSVDGGMSWGLEARLDSSEFGESGNVRIETPSYILDVLPVFQQFQFSRDNQGLIYYEV